MNGIRLFFKSAKGSVLSSLTLFVVLGAVLLTLNYTLSQYLYIRRAGEMFENAGLSGGLHFVNTTPYDAEGQEALDARIESLRESGEMEKLITRRSAGVTIGGTEYQLVLYDVDVYPAMYGAPHKGSWPEGGEPLGGVVAGVNPSSVPGRRDGYGPLEHPGERRFAGGADYRHAGLPADDLPDGLLHQ